MHFNSSLDSPNHAIVLVSSVTSENHQVNSTYGWWGQLACLHVLLDMLMHLRWPSSVLHVIKTKSHRWCQKHQVKDGQDMR